MRFPSPLIEGKLLKRYKRFLADVELANGEVVTAHCANPGSMHGLNETGATVWLSKSDNPKRKLKFSWELVETDLGEGANLVGINTSHPNTLIKEAIDEGIILELRGYDLLRREVRYGKNSRIDILLQSEGKADCYVEVKNVHLMRDPGRAEFPDSVTARGTKHLNELTHMAHQKFRAVMVFLVQRGDAREFSLARDIDPDYGKAFDQATEAGVEILCYSCRITPKKIEVSHSIPVKE